MRLFGDDIYAFKAQAIKCWVQQNVVREWVDPQGVSIHIFQ